MTDLPRFTGGSLGPIGFNQVNEMMRRLDALRPFIESVEISQASTDGLKDRTMIVYAKKRPAVPDEEVAKYDWREIAIKADETVTNFTDEDWEETSLDVATRGSLEPERPEEDPRKDPPPTSLFHAISIADFDEGYAICFVRRDLDGVRQYVLVPIMSGGGTPGLTSDLYRIETVLGSGSVPYSDGIGSVSCFIYTARRISFVIVDDVPALAQASEVFPFYDFGLANPNIPVHPPTAALTPVPLGVGTFFRGTTVEISVGQRIGYLSIPPRLNVECTP